MYVKKGDIKSAVEKYKEALSLMSIENGAEYYSVSGLINLFEGQVDEAISKFEESLNLDANNQTANNYLGMIYLGVFDIKKKDIEKALVYNKKSYEINKLDAGILQNIAFNYYQLGYFNEALHLFKKLVKIMPNNALVKQLLGVSYYKTGNLSSAKLYLNQAISINPDILTEEIQMILDE